MSAELGFRAVTTDWIVDEGTISRRLRHQLHNHRHEVHVVGAGEEHGCPSPHRKAGQDSHDVVARLANVRVAPQLPRDSVDDDERLLVSAGQFVRLVKELPRLQGSKEVGRSLVLDANEVTVRVVSDLDRPDVDVPIREASLCEDLEAKVPLSFPFVNCEDWQSEPP